MRDFRNNGLLLQDSELISSSLNLIQQAISIFDDDLRLRIWNNRFIEMFSFPRHAIYRGAPLENIIKSLAETGDYKESDLQQIIKDRYEVASKKLPYYAEYRQPGGEVLSYEAYPLSSGGWVTVYTDISHLKRNETLLRKRTDLLSDNLLENSTKLSEANRKLLATNRALEEVKHDLTMSEKRMREITQAMPAHIAYITPEYVYTYTNNRLSDIAGIDRPIDPGMHMIEVFGEEVFKETKPLLDKALNGETTTVEYKVPAGSPNARTIRSTFTPERDEEGNIKGVFVLSLNITEEQQALENLLQSKRMETTFQLTSGLAHDFSNILTVIVGNLQHIESQRLDSNARQSLINTTQKAAQRAVRIIEQLMSFTGRQKLTPQNTDISALLTELCRLFSSSIPDKIKLKLALPEETLIAYADEAALQDVLVNLMLNARDAINDNGSIKISAKKLTPQDHTESVIQITVADNGCGFDEETLRRAYDPFFTSKKNKGGSGLGLSMAQGFASQSGGSIEIKSAEGMGAKIILSLPSADHITEKVYQTKWNSVQATKRHKIALLIDDEEDVRQTIRIALRDMGFAVIEAGKPEEAMSLITQIEGIELIVSDIMMPGDINGLELSDRIRRLYPQLPIVLISGLTETDPVIKSINGRYPILKKPFNAEVLMEVLASLSAEEANRYKVSNDS